MCDALKMLKVISYTLFLVKDSSIKYNSINKRHRNQIIKQSSCHAMTAFLVGRHKTRHVSFDSFQVSNCLSVTINFYTSVLLK